jgi:pimeloyl-ACP methyl ester carboxylesterase
LKTRFLPFLALLLAAPLAFAAAPARQGRTCHLPGVEEALRCLSIDVPSNYAQPGGAKIRLHVTIAPALRESARPDPLFVLAGGPGQAGSDLLPGLERFFGRVRATRDVILIDQRGTGLSGRLDCTGGADEESLSDEAMLELVRGCAARLNKPFADYTTANAARDIEQVRKALGYGQVNLWGGSYGTRLAQAYARAFPASVRAAVLDGVASPDQVIPAGGKDAQAALDALFAQCAAEKSCAAAFPDLRTEFAELSGRVAAGKVVLDLPDPRTAQMRHLPVGPARFIGTVHSVLYNPVDSRSLPYLIHSAYQGRWEPFIARANVASDVSTEGALAPILHLAVVCAEDYPRLTPEMQADDEKGSFLGGLVLAERRKLCEAVNVPPVAWAAPARIDAPVLMFSGALDPVTPPRRAEAAGRLMAHVQHLVVRNAGHGITPLGCAPRLVREFLDSPGAPVNGQCLSEIPTASFQVSAAGPRP